MDNFFSVGRRNQIQEAIDWLKEKRDFSKKTQDGRANIFAVAALCQMKESIDENRLPTVDEIYRVTSWMISIRDYAKLQTNEDFKMCETILNSIEKLKSKGGIG